MIAAIRVAERRNIPFEDLFAGQFTLAPVGRVEPIPGYCTYTLAGYTLHAAPDLPVRPIVDALGKPAGWFLGVGVDADGHFLSRNIRLPSPLLSTSALDTADRWALGIGGRFLIILPVPELGAIYQDPIGDMAMVYNPADGLVGSSTLMAVPDGPLWNPAFPPEKVRSGKMNFSLQQCPDQRLLRMLPNHRFELSTFNLNRIWPRPDTPLSEPEHGLEGNIGRISERLKTILTALVRNAPIALPISGGRDSRNLVGALGDAIGDVRFGFAWRFHKMSKIDQLVGASIANRIGLPFKAITYRTTSREDQRLYLRRTGFSTGGRAMQVMGMQLAVSPGHLVLRGNAMELLRANQWNLATIKRGWVRPTFGLNRLLIERGVDQKTIRDQWLGRYTAWAETIPESARCRQLDLAFVEHLLPNTLGVRHLGDPLNFVMNPFSDPELIRLAMQIPPDLRKNNVPNQMLLGRNCAHLADIPFEREVASGADLDDIELEEV